jgi:DNA-binding SARP family transcriptional activator/Tfp pilus assembly protein PilF
LWPDQPSAHGNLRQLLARLRMISRDSGLELFASDHTTVRLRLDSIDTDLSALQSTAPELNWDSAQALLDLYRGELLSGIELPEGETLSWVEENRSALREKLITAMTTLLDRADARSNAWTAQIIASKLLIIDPYQECAYQALMRGFGSVGQIDRVATTFERCRRVLQEGLGIAPSEKTVRLYERLTGAHDPNGKAAANPAPDIRLDQCVALAATPPRLVLLMSQTGGAPQRTRLSNMLLDDVIIGLSALKSVAVLAPHTSWRLSEGDLDAQIIREFAIDYVAQPNLIEHADETRLNLRLFGARDRAIVWADTHSLSDRNFAHCYRGLALGIARSLADAIEQAELARFERDQHPVAYYWHLVGQRHVRELDLPRIRQAKKAFRRAVAADPEFAPGHSGQARAVQREWLLLGPGDPDLLRAAERSGRMSIDLDHRDARGYRELGLCSLYQRRWEDSLIYFAEAERLNPHFADALADYADALAHSGQPEQGLAKLKRAMELNPIPPEQYWWDMAGIHFQLREYRNAIAAVKRMAHPTPGLRVAAASWAYLNKPARARACVAEFLKSYPDFRIEQWLTIVPNRDPEDTRHYEHGLRLAGFQ